jgi:membrane protein implicated in regulation of membrane protease activity
MDTIFLVAAIVGGTILVCQFALSLFGLGHDGADFAHHMGGEFHGDVHVGGDFHGDAHLGGPHADHAAGTHTDSDQQQHTDSSHLFAMVSFRTLVAAATFFGLSGKAALSAGYAPSTAFILATIVGLFAMYGMYRLMRLIAGLSSSGNERIGNAVGRQATVYIPIPATRKGAGKVQLSMQNRIVEYQAVTDDAELLKTGQTVEVVNVIGTDTVQVRRVAEPVQKEPAAV